MKFASQHHQHLDLNMKPTDRPKMKVTELKQKLIEETKREIDGWRQSSTAKAEEIEFSSEKYRKLKSPKGLGQLEINK